MVTLSPIRRCAKTGAPRPAILEPNEKRQDTEGEGGNRVNLKALCALLRPSVASLGYGLFLAINAASVWGGVFPFLPLAFQTPDVMLWFSAAESVAFTATFLASAAGTWFFPAETRHFMVKAVAVPYMGGWCLLIGAMYLNGAAVGLSCAGGTLLGVGSAGFYMLWQRLFASQDAREGMGNLIAGTAWAAVLYFALYLIPVAVTAYLIPCVFLPLFGLAAVLKSRTIDLAQPMFEDVPRDHPHVYRTVVRDYWRSALCVGSLAFASGVIRGVALLHEEISSLVNSASMLGALLSAVVLLVLWHRMSFRFGLISVFRVAYPLLITGFLLLPFCGPIYLNAFAAVAYMVFSLVQMLMMMQCAQVSRDRGINPVFIYGFFGAVAYILQSLGFLFGWASDLVVPTGSQWLYFVAIIASYGLGLTLLVSTGTLVRPLVTKGAVTMDPIEFVSLAAAPSKAEARPVPASSHESGEVASGLPNAPAAAVADSAPVKRRRRRASASEDAGAIRDRLSKQCLVLQERYGLSMREAEVMELIARGNSMAAIADRLVISENTVRTHAKHIYTKLDIHRRQELLDMLSELGD